MRSGLPLLPIQTSVAVVDFELVSQGLWRWLESPWQRRAAPAAPKTDAIVVLSGGRHPASGPTRLSEWHDPDRFFAGLDLFRAGKAPRLLFTGGASPFLPGQRRKASATCRKRGSLVSLLPPWPVRHLW